ncbi:MAG TPA: DUF1775 domain-containing protein [Candidatus Saccharimonadales bacterium]|jgi:uncharacterized protein YcnI|nr:DUF1775 domain-containing protein [Candidatus Saccharimonadales bacterium]
MKKLLTAAVTTVTIVLALPSVAFAHVIVTPGQAGVGQELVFNVSVPNERDTAVSSVKLDIPKGVSDVTPTITPGWHITTSGSKGDVTEIIWTGNIPVGQRADFSLSAQVPPSPTQLDWKAYQTYADGTVVHWDQKPMGSDDASSTAGPFSVTKVVDDLNQSVSSEDDADSHKTTLAFVFSVAALALSAGGLLLRRGK